MQNSKQKRNMTPIVEAHSSASSEVVQQRIHELKP